jgi:hypothetical protein
VRPGAQPVEASPGTLGLYGAVAAGTFVVFSGLLKWQIFGSRLQLPFFLLMAPFVGATVRSFLPNLALGMLGVGIAAAGWPWMTGIPSRPLLTSRDQLEHSDSDQVSMYFTQQQGESSQAIDP